MKFKILFLLFFLINANIFSQKQVISNLASSNSLYEFYIFNDENVIDENGNPLEAKKFLLNDKTIIENLVKTWTGEETNEMYNCGYNYTIYIILDNKIIEKISYNSECNQAISSNGIFTVKNNPFKNLIFENHFSDYTFKTNDIDLAREFLNKASEVKKIQIPNLFSYNWYKYDGRFFIQIDKKRNEKKLKPMEFYEKEMHDTYKDYQFKVDFWGCCDTYEAWIYSSENFRDVFNLYGRKGEFDKIKNEYNVYIFGKTEDISEVFIK